MIDKIIELVATHNNMDVSYMTSGLGADTRKAISMCLVACNFAEIPLKDISDKLNIPECMAYSILNKRKHHMIDKDTSKIILSVMTDAVSTQLTINGNRYSMEYNNAEYAIIDVSMGDKLFIAMRNDEFLFYSSDINSANIYLLKYIINDKRKLHTDNRIDKDAN